MENTTVVKNNSIGAKDILEALVGMQANMAYVNDALAKLETVRSDGPEDIGAQAKAKAMADVVICHETTNQKMIALYEKMYNDISSEQNVLNKIENLHKNLVENSAISMHRLSDVICAMCGNGGENENESVADVCNVFSMREHNLRLLLEFYIKEYEELKKSN